MPRSKTATDCEVFAVISLAIKRPVQPPPMMATSTGLRLVMKEPRFPSPLFLFGAVQPILPRPAAVVEVGLGQVGLGPFGTFRKEAAGDLSVSDAALRPV